MANELQSFLTYLEEDKLRKQQEQPVVEDLTAYKQFELEGEYFKTICTGSFELDAANNSRQSFPKTYTPNGYIDILKTSYILKNQLKSPHDYQNLL